MTRNAQFAPVGDGQVLELLRERLPALSDYDLGCITIEAAQQLQFREHTSRANVLERIAHTFDTLVWGKA